METELCLVTKINFSFEREFLNILVLSSKYPPEYAGSGLRAHRTYRRLAEQFDINYDVVTNSEEFTDDCAYRFEAVPVRRISRRASGIGKVGWSPKEKLKRNFKILRNYYLQAPATVRHLSSGEYDLIHTFGDSISVHAGMYYALLKKIPLVREICNTATALKPMPLLPFKLHRLFPFRYTKRTRVVAISKGIEKMLLGAGVTPDVIWERPNPVNEDVFYFDDSLRSELRLELTPFTDNDRIILNISKFIPRKNQLFLLDVLSFLPTDYKLILAGPIVSSGPNYERDQEWLNCIYSRIKELGFQSRVVVRPNFVNNVAQYYRLADVFAFPTKEDALGTPMLESIACGTPVVANQIPGVTDQWIKNGHGGYVCPSKPDPDKPLGWRLSPSDNEFAESIQKATKIKRSVRRSESKRILQIASTRVIDDGYMKMFNDIYR